MTHSHPPSTPWWAAALSLALGAFLAPSCPAQGTAFSYQGRLTEGGQAANGSYDLVFSLFAAPAGGVALGGTLTNAAVPVSAGTFTVGLDFGAQFPGEGRWLEIAVRTNGNGTLTRLAPRQPLTPAPYAITAGAVSGPIPGGAIVKGSITGAQLAAGAVTSTNIAFEAIRNENISVDAAISPSKIEGGPGSGLDADTLDGLESADFARVGHNHDQRYWNLGGNAGTLPAGSFLGTLDATPLVLRANNLKALQLESGPGGTSALVGPENTLAAGASNNSILGGRQNLIEGGVFQSTIAGGELNRIRSAATMAFIGGGRQNDIGSDTQHPVIVGGRNNFIGSNCVVSLIAAGAQNSLLPSIDGGLIAGGFRNQISGSPDPTHRQVAPLIVGGSDNLIGVSSSWSSILGGDGNSIGAGATGAVIVAGMDNRVADGASHALAAGWHAHADHAGSFVWADSATTASFGSGGPNQFVVRAAGGMGVGVSNPAGQLHVASASGAPQVQVTQNNSADYARLRLNVAGGPSWEMDVSPGATPGISWWNTTLRMNLDYNGNLTTSGTVNGTSDRNAKENFAAVGPRAVLDKVAALPISEWNFKNEPGVRHIGPMAQDFQAAFQVGMDDKHIATVDADGVALAAIQGLNQKVEAEGAALRAENAALKQDLAELRLLVLKLSAKRE